MRLTCSNFFKTFALQPCSRDLSGKDRVKAWAATLILGIFSGGLLQLGCLIAKGMRKGAPDPRTSSIFNSQVSQTQNSTLDLAELIGRPLDELKNPQALPNSDYDIRGTNVLHIDHIRLFATQLIVQHPEVSFPTIGGKDVFAQGEEYLDSLEKLNDHLSQKKFDDTKKYIAYPLQVSRNHFILIFIDREKRVVEYYDSMGGKPSICKEAAKILTERDPGAKPYTADFKIKNALQHDGYQCGVWTCFFIEKKLKDPQFDFNAMGAKLGADGLDKMIALYRNKVILDITNFLNLWQQWLEKTEKAFEEKYPVNYYVSVDDMMWRANQFELLCHIVQGIPLLPTKSFAVTPYTRLEDALATIDPEKLVKMVYAGQLLVP